MRLLPKHLALMLFITLVWGFNLVASKYGLRDLPPLLMTACRYLLLLAVLMPFLRLHPGQTAAIIFCGVTLGALHFGLMIAGLSMAEDISTVAIALPLAVPFTTIASIIWLDERVGWRRWLGIALSFGGILIIGLDWGVLRYIEGLLLVIAAAFVVALGVPASKRLRNIGVLDFQAWVAVVSAPTLLGLSLMVESPTVADISAAKPITWLAVAYSALGAGLIGHGGHYYLVQRYDVSLIAPMTLLAPLFGIAFGVTLMGDDLSPRMMLGGAMTLIGVFIIAARQTSDGVGIDANRGAWFS